MSPPGRRRIAAMSTKISFLAFFFFFLITSAQAASSVLGLDFGTLNLKAVLVKPGIPFEIVLSKDSKRRETAAVAFKPNRDAKNKIAVEAGSFPERLYGGDALALQGRLPGEVFPNLKSLLGLSAAGGVVEDGIVAYKSRYPSVQAEPIAGSGSSIIKSEAFVAAEASWSVEELLAMELANIRRNAEGMAGGAVQDVVITVPIFYTAEERRAIERAADLAGISVKALVSDGLAVGLDYAKSRTFPNINAKGKPEYHIVYDMGAASTTATLLRFQSRSVKDVGRFNKTVQEVAVVGAGYDRLLGGDSLNSLLLNHWIAQFLHTPAMKARGADVGEVRSNGRLMARLLKDVEKARQVLSANTETSSGFEELLPDVDFRVKTTRADFEGLASAFADRVVGPVNDALATAQLTIADIDSIILHGGAVRTPLVHKKLEALAGSSKLKTNVNSDEAAVFGAAFKGAGLSPSFKVKEIRDSDIAIYPAGMKYIDAGKERRQGLFTPTSVFGNGATTKQVTFKDKDDFSFKFYQVVGDLDKTVSLIETTNLTASVKELQTKFGCEKEEISTKFAIRLSPLDGVPEVISGTVSCEVEGSAKAASVGDSVKDWLGLGKKKDQEPLVDGEDGPVEEVEATSTTVTPSASTSSTTAKVSEKPKKRMEIVGIAFVTSPQGDHQPTLDETLRMRGRLAAFDRSDRARIAREEALNVLESYTYHVRDLLNNEDYTVFSTDDQRSTISSLLATTREFMESSQLAKAVEKELKEKYQALKTLVDPIKLRKDEASARPAKLETLRTSLEQTQKLMEMVKQQVEQASAAQEKASSLEAAKSGESATPAASVVDDLDDLEEADASATTELGPKYTDPSNFSPYTSADLTELTDVHEKVAKWLDENEAAQKLSKLSDNPLFSIKDIEAQASKLSDAMTDLVYKKMKKPSKSSSSKKPKATKSKAGKASSTASTASTSVTEAPDASESETGRKKPTFVTVNPGDEMPSEEEILRMISQANADQPSSSTTTHDEL